MDARRVDHVSAESRYAAIHKIVYQRTSDRFPNVTAKHITQAAIQRADMWKKEEHAQGRQYRSSWHWQEAYRLYRNKPNRFEISLWHGGNLGALCLGQTSRTAGRVRLDLIEASPLRPHVLGFAALPILSFAGSIFAAMVGASEVWIVDPDPALERYYESEGFSGRMAYHSNRKGQRRII